MLSAAEAEELTHMSERVCELLDQVLGRRVEIVQETAHDRFVAELAMDPATAAGATNRLKIAMLLARDLSLLQNLLLRGGLRGNMRMARAALEAVEALVEETANERKENA